MVNTKGYILVKIYSNNPFYQMAQKKGGYSYVLEHRLVIARHLNRCLEPREYVHHKNGDKTDNRLENLVLVDSKEHGRKYKDGYKEGYEAGCKDALLNGVKYLKKR